MSKKSSCPSCGSLKSKMWSRHVWHREADMEVRQCLVCLLVYLYPPMNDVEEREYYANYEAHIRARSVEGVGLAADLFRTTLPEAERRAKSLLRFIKPTMKLVEVGASTGAFLHTVRQEVAEVTGIEPSRVHAEHMAGLGIATAPYLEDLDPDLKFDAAAVFHVLEHMKRPVQFLADLAARLHPGAYVFVEVPNVQDALLSFYECESFKRFYFQPMHAIYFSPSTLRDVCARAGLDEIEMIPVQRYDLSNHLVWLQHGEPGGKGRFSAVFTDSLESEYAACLKESWLCDTMLGVFQRP